ALHAHPVYKLLGKPGLPAKDMPKLNEPVMGTIGYHIRSGKHDVTRYDWQRDVEVAQMHLTGVDKRGKASEKADQQKLIDEITKRGCVVEPDIFTRKNPGLFVGLGEECGDDDLKLIRNLRSVTAVSLIDTRVTNAGLQHLSGLSEVRFLRVGGAKISDEGM